MNSKSSYQLCVELLRGCDGEKPDYDSTVIPYELADYYTSILAAKKLGTFPKSIEIEAVFCRSALTETEDDRVRIECVQQLLNSGSLLLEGVLLGLLFDDDEEMRLTAVEGLCLMKSKNMEQALGILSHDKSEEVFELMKSVASGEEINLYHLDTP